VGEKRQSHNLILKPTHNLTLLFLSSKSALQVYLRVVF
jgi:hypothetical protein